MLKSYLKNNIYKNTREVEATDKLNRHLIFHALEDNIEFTFGNYLRLFNCLSYLSWVIGMTNEGCSVLSQANEQDVMDKWADYLKILVISEALNETKVSIYKKEIVSFKKYLPKQYLPFIEQPETRIKKILEDYNFLKGFEKSKINSIPKLFKGILFFNSIRRAPKS